MGLIYIRVLLAGFFVLLGILSSKFSARLGLPVLVLFLGLGMLAGSEGLGGIPFKNYQLAYDIGSVALALILFDGGLHTSRRSIRAGWRPAFVLSTFGVMITSAITAVVAFYVFKIPVLHAMLLGGIVGSTDAAAVFSTLRSSGLSLPERLESTLEIESGSNDPMAIFLTIGITANLVGTARDPQDLVMLFGLQFGIGGLVGLVVGRLASAVVNGIQHEARGLYPILVSAFGLLAFGLAGALQGSGFLAVYVAGIVIGTSPLVFRRGICLFHDALAWLSQIVLFLTLGLLSSPTRLLTVGLEGLALAMALIFVARPVAVFVLMPLFRFSLREMVVLAWGGLKGAVPITLAMFPLIQGVDQSDLIFDAVFFVVLISALVKGWSLSPIARKLGVGRPAKPAPRVSVEVNALQHLDADIVDYTVSSDARIVGRPLRDVALPEGVMFTLVVRSGKVVVPRGTTVLYEDDHVFVTLPDRLRTFVDQLFVSSNEPIRMESGLTARFDAHTAVRRLDWLLYSPESGADRTLRELAAASDHPLLEASAALHGFQLVQNEDAEFVTLIVDMPESTDLPEPPPKRRLLPGRRRQKK